MQIKECIRLEKIIYYMKNYLEKTFLDYSWTGFLNLNLAVFTAASIPIAFITWMADKEFKVSLIYYLPVLFVLIAASINFFYLAYLFRHIAKMLLDENERLNKRLEISGNIQNCMPQKHLPMVTPRAVIPIVKNLANSYSYTDYRDYIIIRNNKTGEEANLQRDMSAPEKIVDGGFRNVLNTNPGIKKAIGKALTGEINIFNSPDDLNVQIFENGIMIWEASTHRHYFYPQV